MQVTRFYDDLPHLDTHDVWYCEKGKIRRNRLRVQTLPNELPTKSSIKKKKNHFMHKNY
jgi:hypothetical protein